jgi:hypothetical protein
MLETLEPLRPSQLLSASGPNGRAKFANGDFGRELRVTRGKAIFSATTCMQKTPLARAIWRFERRIPRDKDWVAEQGGFEPPVSREGFLQEKGRECWRYYTSKSTSIFQRMSSHSVRYGVRRQP